MKIRAYAGRPYGHVPGHSFLDCEVKVRRKQHRLKSEAGYIATAVVSWGSAQGHDEVHGTAEASAFGATAHGALLALKSDADDLAEGDAEKLRYVRTAMSRALEAA